MLFFCKTYVFGLFYVLNAYFGAFIPLWFLIPCAYVYLCSRFITRL